MLQYFRASTKFLKNTGHTINGSITQLDMKRNVNKMCICIMFLILLLVSCVNTIKINTFNVSGRVILGDEGYEGVVVTLQSPRFGEVSAISGSFGEYEFVDVWNGDYSIEIGRASCRERV